MGFCWQHVPVKGEGNRERWKLRIEGAALAVSASELLIKIIELAVEHCHEFFGPGDDQTRAKEQIEVELDLEPEWPDMPHSYAPGARVDWQSLLQLLVTAKQSKDNPENANIENLERSFVQWLDNLNDYHKEELLKAIAAYSE
jgi:hypothetical protein